MLFNIYKKKQGKIVRWGSFFIGSLLFLFGGYRLYGSFPYIDTLPEDRPEFWKKAFDSLFDFTIPAVEIPIDVTPRLLICIAITIGLLLLLFLLVFKHKKISDFLIDTESEMRKVAWPTINEVMDSSLVVIFVIIIMGLYLFFVDIGLSKVFDIFFF